MAFVLELKTTTKQSYIKNMIINITRKYGINTTVSADEDRLGFAFDSEHEDLQKCLDSIAKELPASIFLKDSSSCVTDEKPSELAKLENNYPLNLGLCPSCQKEMLDVSSKRYYYPFTTCNSCGANHAFLHTYPYERKNTSFKFLSTCKTCENEIQNVGKKEKHHINSCHECGVPVRLKSKSSERYANDAGSFRTMFEVSAKAINDNKRVLIKTTMGYRVFYKADKLNHNSILMMINASKITDYLSLITEEFNTLLSIERPILHVTLKDENLKDIYGANTAYVKYPDDGFSILLGTELQKLGVDYVGYEAVDESCEADMIMDYDLELSVQNDIRVFLNKDISFIASGERVSFPSHNFHERSVLSVSNSLVGVPYHGKMLFDKMEYFNSVNVEKTNILEGIDETYHSKQMIYSKEEASFMSVIAEKNLFDKKCVGAYFDEEPSFLYYDSKKVIKIVPPKNFDTVDLLQNISNLREGSDKLVINLEKKLPQMYEKLQALQKRDNIKLFEAVAIILACDDESMRGVIKEAMKFVGKGGIQIDTHVKDNRFDHISFLASIISYQLAGVSSSILAYSIFESFGDYFSELIAELKDKTKSTEIILCGSGFANQSLFSRMQRNLKMTPPHMNSIYPIGDENAVIGGVYL